MSAKLQQIVIVLKRDGQSTPWGIRLVGGNDLDTPLIITRVQVNSPASDKILRGDVIAKVGEYDARDLSHADAQTLFRTAGNEIRIVVHRDNKIASNQGLSVDSNSRPNSVLFSASPNSSVHNRTPSPYGNVTSPYERNLDMPFETLPQTFFPKLATPGGCVSPPLTSRTEGGTTGGRFSPLSTHRYRLQQELAEEQAIIVNQPYRTTPLVLPGAKVKKDAPTTESYLRHYPNPAVRAPPGHDYHDTIMKQRVADTMLHKVVGPEADSGRVFHKQFNSPIGLYSENNIESTIRQTVPYKKTISFDPSKSETFKAIQEEGYTNSDIVKEVMIPVQPKTFQPNKMVPGKKSLSSAAPVSRPPYNVVNTRDETIRQSGSFNRLMYSVLGASEY